MMVLATCPTCGRVMDGASCTDTRAFAWGAEPDWPAMREAPNDPSWPCHDCGTWPGGRHHQGCTVARCALGCLNPHSRPPSAPDQAAFCDHADDSEGGDELPVPPRAAINGLKVRVCSRETFRFERGPWPPEALPGQPRPLVRAGLSVRAIFPAAKV
jgi:hypothetical protein